MTILLLLNPMMKKPMKKRFEPVSERVRVEFNGTWMADSSNALVVYWWRIFDISPWSIFWNSADAEPVVWCSRQKKCRLRCWKLILAGKPVSGCQGDHRKRWRSSSLYWWRRPGDFSDCRRNIQIKEKRNWSSWSLPVARNFNFCDSLHLKVNCHRKSKVYSTSSGFLPPAPPSSFPGPFPLPFL